ncbi:MAG: SIS domain-containing protein [Xanthomonadaceae bacterium]|nr:SIS domain-containing protein [Xanthomonadaceae bacterium]
MFEEAGEAAAAVRRQFELNASRVSELGDTLRRMRPRAVVTCARGSSDHAATFAKYLIETRAGALTSSAAPSVSSVYAAPAHFENALFIAISQSGQSPDLLACARRAREAGARLLAVVNANDSPLAKLADFVLPLHAGSETSVAATKSWIASLAAIAQLVAHWTDDQKLLAAVDRLSDQLAQAWTLDWSRAVEALRSTQNMYVLGRGYGLAAAQESALKLKETCGMHAEAISTAEVRHGPMALIREGFPVLVYAQNDRTHEGVQALLDALIERGAHVFVAGAAHARATVLPTIESDPVTQPLLEVQSFYRMANALALARGLDPDHPPNLRKVTETL